MALLETVNKCSHFLILIKGRNSFFNRILPWRCHPDCLRSLLSPTVTLGRAVHKPFVSLTIRRINCFKLSFVISGT